MSNLVLSNSRIKTFRSCHYAHYLKYVKKLELKAKIAPLERGKAIHACLEAYNNGQSWKKEAQRFEKNFYDTTLSHEREELGDLPTMVYELMDNYTTYYEDDELEFIQNELHFELPLIDGVSIQGYIDAVVRQDNKNYGMEYKTFARRPDRSFIVFNTQAAIYTWASQQLGLDFQGIIWDIIRAKTPTNPKMTAGGKLSTASLDSTPLTVEKGLIKLGVDLESSQAQALLKSVSYENYLNRYRVPMNQDIVNRIMDDTKQTALLISECGEMLKDRNLGKDCSFCSYKSICQAEMMGIDVDFIIKKDFKVRKREEENQNGEKETSSKLKKLKGRG